MHKLSLRSATLISLNVMVGFGIFVNTVILSKISGFLGFVSYALVAALVAPLILSTAKLMRLHPTGGFYAYGAENIGAWAGFLSAWGYFVGKLASAALIIHVVMSLFQTLIPVLAMAPVLVLDILVISLFTFLNTWHMRIGSQVAGLFFVLKLTPLLFAIVSGLYLVSGGAFIAQPLLWSGIPASIPLVVYAFMGFEACCSLSQSIENPEKNGPRVIYLSFAFAILLNVLYQFLFFTATQGELMGQTNYLDAFPTLVRYLLPASPLFAHKVVSILHLAVATAALGGAYGILFATHWNLYTLAEKKLIFFPEFFTKRNSHYIPVACVVAEAVLCISYLVLTRGNQVPLQQLSVLGTTLAYTISMIGLWFAQKRLNTVSVLTKLALVSCSIFIGMCLRNFVLFGMQALYFLLFMLAFGMIMFFASTHFKREQSN
jgi:amino acid transporter